MQKYETVEEYIYSFPKDVQKILEEIRSAIKEVAPEAKEKIAYGIPTFTFHGNLVHYAAYKNHIGFYPTPSVINKLKKLEKYKTGKGTIQFPLSEPIPYDLIREVTRLRIEENLSRG